MSYNPADHPYPAHRFGPNDAFRVVNNADEDAQARDEGFADHPTRVGKAVAKPPTPPKPAAPTPAPVAQTKATKAKSKDKSEKPADPAPAAPVAPPAPAPEVEFDRTAAIARLEAANFEVDPATTDDELVEALAELDKG